MCYGEDVAIYSECWFKFITESLGLILYSKQASCGPPTVVVFCFMSNFSIRKKILFWLFQWPKSHFKWIRKDNFFMMLVLITVDQIFKCNFRLVLYFILNSFVKEHPIKTYKQLTQERLVFISNFNSFDLFALLSLIILTNQSCCYVHINSVRKFVHFIIFNKLAIKCKSFPFQWNKLISFYMCVEN